MSALRANSFQATMILQNYLKCPQYGCKARKIGWHVTEHGKSKIPNVYNALSHFIGSSVYLHSNGSRLIVARMSKSNRPRLTAISESSENANEDILFFFFQLDLTTRIQCALNSEDYQLAQQLQNKLAEVEQEAARQRKLKMGLSLPKDEAQDASIFIMRLRSDLQKALAAEEYSYAAHLRDKIADLQGDSLAAEARALVYQSQEYVFRLGQKVRHAVFGYRGVICGMDPYCCESSSWIETANTDKLSRGRHQPFYQVLVDVHAELNVLVAYGALRVGRVFDLIEVVNMKLKIFCFEKDLVAEENLLQPNEPDMDTFDHPYIFFLFYGMDSAGDYIPIKQLREKFGRPRHEVDSNEEDDKPDN